MSCCYNVQVSLDKMSNLGHTKYVCKNLLRNCCIGAKGVICSHLSNITDDCIRLPES